MITIYQMVGLSKRNVRWHDEASEYIIRVVVLCNVFDEENSGWSYQ